MLAGICCSCFFHEHGIEFTSLFLAQKSARLLYHPIFGKFLDVFNEYLYQDYLWLANWSNHIVRDLYLLIVICFYLFWPFISRARPHICRDLFPATSKTTILFWEEIYYSLWFYVCHLKLNHLNYFPWIIDNIIRRMLK